MVLNKAKSGIVTFATRDSARIPLMINKRTVEIRKRKYKTKKQRPDTVEVTHSEWVPHQKDIKGVPVCSQYKYLGTILTPKLDCGPQIKQIKRKAGHLLVKLGPYLANSSAEGRKDLFVT